MRHLKLWRPGIQKGCTEKRGMEKSKVFFAACNFSNISLDLAEFTGVTAPYESPDSPEIHIKTNEVEVADAVRMIVEYLADKQFI